MNKLFLSNEGISIALRDFFLIYHSLGVKLFLTNIVLKPFVKCIIRPFWTYRMKFFPKSFLYYQQGRKSLS